MTSIISACVETKKEKTMYYFEKSKDNICSFICNFGNSDNWVRISIFDEVDNCVLTTIGTFLDKISPKVRADILDLLVEYQKGVRYKSIEFTEVGNYFVQSSLLD